MASACYSLTADAQLYASEPNASRNLILIDTTTGGGSTPSTLMRVNPTTGVLTPIGLTGVNNIGGIAFDTGFSTLYGIESGAFVGISPKLYTIDPATGAVTFAVLTDIPVEVSSLEYYNSELIAGGADDNLYRIDPATGVATVIGAMGASGGKVSGLSFRSASLPASGPLALFITIAAVAALGGLTIAARAPKSKSA